MSRLRIRHVTGHRYDQPAAASYNEARMMPVSDENQLVISSRLDVEPSAAINTYVDYWGTSVASFDILSPHTELTLTSEAVVEVRPKARNLTLISWKDLFSATEQERDLAELIDQTEKTEPSPELSELAEDIAVNAQTPYLAATQICQLVYDSVMYLPNSTNVFTPAAEAWEGKSGVCQDIAHITVGALRHVHIPARYVSGYLHPDPQAPLRTPVQGESHAWIDWFSGSWVQWDPTNAMPVGEQHIRIGHGRDYADVPPLHGVYASRGGSSTMFVSVEVIRES